MSLQTLFTKCNGPPVLTIPEFQIRPCHISILITGMVPKRLRKGYTCAVRPVRPGIETAQENPVVRIGGRPFHRQSARSDRRRVIFLDERLPSGPPEQR